jgi:hypothetical protein
MFNDYEYFMNLNNAISDLTGSYFMTNISKDYKSAIIQAAKETGFDVYTEDVAFWSNEFKVLKGSIGVYTRQPGTDHSPFWKRFDEIRGNTPL